MTKVVLTGICLTSLCCAIWAQPPPPPPPEDMEMMPPPPHPPTLEWKGGKNLDRILSQLPAADQAELRKQIKENPGNTKKILHQYFEGQRKKDMERVKKLRDNYFNAKDDAEKEKALEALKADIRREMTRHLEHMQKGIEDMSRQIEGYQKRLNKIKAHYEKRKANQDKDVEKILKDLTDPDKPFPPSPPPKKKKKVTFCRSSDM